LNATETRRPPAGLNTTDEMGSVCPDSRPPMGSN